MTRAGAGEQGLTLIEAMFAMALLSFGLLALFGPMHYATVSLSESKNRALAVELATSRMELIKIDPPAFFDRVPVEKRPLAQLPGLWHHSLLDQEFGEISGATNFACYVLLTQNLAANGVGIVRVPVVWQRVGGKFSTTDGEPFDPNDPDAHPASVELRSVIRYR